MINIKSLLDNNIPCFPEQGEIIFNEMVIQFELTKKVVLDFNGIERLGMGFVHATIGRFYQKYGKKIGDSSLEYIGINDYFDYKINQVIKITIDEEYRNLLEEGFKEAINLC